jgi:hypothetical protein
MCIFTMQRDVNFVPVLDDTYDYAWPRFPSELDGTLLLPRSKGSLRAMCVHDEIRSFSSREIYDTGDQPRIIHFIPYRSLYSESDLF